MVLTEWEKTNMANANVTMNWILYADADCTGGWKKMMWCDQEGDKDSPLLKPHYSRIFGLC
jgi:hypothetical protein